MLPCSLYYSLLKIAFHLGLHFSEEHQVLCFDLVSFSPFLFFVYCWLFCSAVMSIVAGVALYLLSALAL